MRRGLCPPHAWMGVFRNDLRPLLERHSSVTRWVAEATPTRPPVPCSLRGCCTEVGRVERPNALERPLAPALPHPAHALPRPSHARPLRRVARSLRRPMRMRLACGLVNGRRMSRPERRRCHLGARVPSPPLKALRCEHMYNMYPQASFELCCRGHSYARHAGDTIGVCARLHV